MLKLPCQLMSLSTKHNFVKNEVEYVVELSVLGQKITAQVSEEFVQSLDKAAESQPKTTEIAPRQQTRQPQPQAQQTPLEDRKKKALNKFRQRLEERRQEPVQEEIDYSVGHVDDYGYDGYSDEDIGQL